MSKPDIASLFLSMPERFQANGFAEYVRSLLASGDTQKASTFFHTLYGVEGYDLSKAAVGQFLIAGYVDNGQCDAALEVYELLEKLSSEDGILIIRAKSLLKLVKCLLPVRLEMAITLWERIEEKNPPLESLWAMSKIGMEILKIAIHNNDMTARKRVYRYLYPENEEC